MARQCPYCGTNIGNDYGTLGIGVLLFAFIPGFFLIELINVVLDLPILLNWLFAIAIDIYLWKKCGNFMVCMWVGIISLFAYIFVGIFTEWFGLLECFLT